MKVFISWSGELSKQLGESLRKWLRGVLQSGGKGSVLGFQYWLFWKSLIEFRPWHDSHVSNMLAG